MILKFFCPLWGSEHLPFEEFLGKVQSAGYDGIEMSFPLKTNERDKIIEMIRGFELQFIAQHWETVTSDFHAHCLEYEVRLRAQASARPKFINSQTGKDYFSLEQNGILISLADAIMEETGIPIIHETHRGKSLFAAHVASNYFRKYPTLRICLDISHWCCVAESLLEDQEEHVLAAVERTDHIHARVGHSQGPQVMDPRDARNAAAVTRHLVWWRSVMDKHKQRGESELTITPEFGAPPYQHVFPYTHSPMYSQWDVNLHMMNVLKQHLS